MIEIKFVGRGGQGAVIASQILAKVFFLMGKYPQCFSVFGGERRGAPVASFLRVDDKKIFLKCGDQGARRHDLHGPGPRRRRGGGLDAQA